ncbi:pyruvate formate-lyase-activating enzyme [Catellatospora sp. IY07-71]|uniref:pyruvate formate-lyase-activating protein n=1 Tax=Catellatospora sp. IY07-71 TaxID=2728827 RepID=UPI001BB45FAC|nr:pyruvate formate-lyase-activating protein [Catellatospora sp. IY07-71]BCJ75772.1 pyruvate formate-lyase-activating enzyme [Catellatospora sp. IY07-71]
MTTPSALTGAVHSFDLSTGVDGPGTRFTAFLAGCPLRCLYCHSPDTWHRRNGTPTTVDQLMAEIGKYRRFIRVAGGGVTLSGGEPLLQPAFTREVLRRCRDLGLHTALDTSGFLGDRADDTLLDAVDLVLLDVKAHDPATYRRVTRTGDVTPTLRFARRLSDAAIPMWIRFVLVPGLTDGQAGIEALAAFAAGLRSVQRVEVLPFHRLGSHKYEALGLDFPLRHVAAPPPAAVEAARVVFRSHGLNTY